MGKHATALNDAIEMYVASRLAEGVKPASVRGERLTLKYLLADVGNLDINHLRPQHMDRFWAKRTTWGPGSMNKGRYHLLSFFHWCQMRGHLSRDNTVVDMLERKRPLRVPPRDRIYIPPEDFETFLGQIEEPRTRIMVAIGLYLMVRLSEAANLRWQDMNLDADEPVAMVYRMKTETLKAVPISEELGDELRRWRLTYAAGIGRPLRPGDFVVPFLKQGGMVGVKGTKGFARAGKDEWLPDRPAHFSHSIKKALTEAGYYQPREGGHTLRRSGASGVYVSLTEAGHDGAMRTAQELLGHSTVTTTEGYLNRGLQTREVLRLYAGKRMFPKQEDATVVEFPDVSQSSERGV